MRRVNNYILNAICSEKKNLPNSINAIGLVQILISTNKLHLAYQIFV